MDIEKIYFKHYRPMAIDKHLSPDEFLNHYSRGKSKWIPSIFGGLTECHIVLSNGQDIVGIAECSHKDNFCYATGRKIAYGRAMKKYNKLFAIIPMMA